ncbi:hypothetical protein AB0I52_31870 [Streptomyces sp. NPDC050423]|uniref:hypothetical protein n=1 Tax=Streptomyces sp. NPDC050423 TaxID=3155402 RepID=UPI00341B34D0
MRAIARRRSALVAELPGRSGNAASGRAQPRDAAGQPNTGPSGGLSRTSRGGSSPWPPPTLIGHLFPLLALALREQQADPGLRLAGDGRGEPRLRLIPPERGNVSALLLVVLGAAKG